MKSFYIFQTQGTESHFNSWSFPSSRVRHRNTSDPDPGGSGPRLERPDLPVLTHSTPQLPPLRRFLVGTSSSPCPSSTGVTRRGRGPGPRLPRKSLVVRPEGRRLETKSPCFMRWVKGTGASMMLGLGDWVSDLSTDGTGGPVTTPILLDWARRPGTRRPLRGRNGILRGTGRDVKGKDGDLDPSRSDRGPRR